MPKKNTMYEVGSDKSGWDRVTNAIEVRQGFLHYEMKDGTNGLARPGTWRHIEKKWPASFGPLDAARQLGIRD